MAHLKDEAYRDAHVMVRASQSLLELYQSWEEAKIDGTEFRSHWPQRVDLILRSTRHLTRNPLVQRIDRAKKPLKTREPDNDASPGGTPALLQEIHRQSRNIRAQLAQLTSQEAESLSEDGPGGPTVTISQLQKPRISRLCKTIRASTKIVAERLKQTTP